MKREGSTTFLVLGCRVVLGGWKWAPAGRFSLERGEAIARENEYSLIEQFLVFLPGSPWLRSLTKCTLHCYKKRSVLQGFDFFLTAGSLDCRVVQFRPKGGGGLNWDHGATIVMVLLHGFGLYGVQGPRKLESMNLNQVSRFEWKPC